ncbi:unnamed protein product [Caenorhabditis nigoni]
MENDSKALVKRSQQPGDLENDFPNDAKRSKHQEGPNISLEDARKEIIRSNCSILQDMVWKTDRFVQKLAEKWEVGEEGQEEMMKLCQGLMEFYKAIDGKRKEMEDHQAKVEKVQKKEKAVLNEKNENQDQEPADTNDRELPVTTQKGVARDVPADQFMNACHTSKVNVQSSSKSQEIKETDKNTAMIDVNCEHRAEQLKNDCLAFNIISPSQTSTSQENNKTGDQVPATTEDETAPNVSTEQLDDPCQIPTNIPMPSSSSTQENNKTDDEIPATTEDNAAPDVSAEQNESPCQIPKNIPTPSPSTSQNDPNTCVVCREGTLVHTVPNLPCITYNCTILPNAPYYTYQVAKDNKQSCETCFNNMAAEEKEQVRKLKNLCNDVVNEEKCFRCKECNTMAHVACLDGGRSVNDFCCQAEGKLLGQPSVEDLEETEFANALQAHLQEIFKVALFVRELNVSKEKFFLADFTNYKKCEKLKNQYRNQEFTARTIAIFQRIDGADILIVMFFMEEYVNIKDKNVLVPTFLDSVQFFGANDQQKKDPRSINGPVAKTSLEFYSLYMKEKGFTDLHLYAQCPRKGESFILNVHPKWHNPLGQSALIGWYGRLFDQMLKNGKIESVRVFEDLGIVFNDYEDLDKFPFYSKSLWSRMISHCYPGDKYFGVNMHEAMTEHAKDNFFIRLSNEKPNSIPEVGKLSVVPMARTQESFFHFCAKKDKVLEFSTQRHMKYSSQVVIKAVADAQKKNKKNHESSKNKDKGKGRRNGEVEGDIEADEEAIDPNQPGPSNSDFHIRRHR